MFTRSRISTRWRDEEIIEWIGEYRLRGLKHSEAGDNCAIVKNNVQESLRRKQRSSNTERHRIP